MAMFGAAAAFAPAGAHARSAALCAAKEKVDYSAFELEALENELRGAHHRRVVPH